MVSKYSLAVASFTVLLAGCATTPPSTGYVKAPSEKTDGYAIRPGPDFLTATYQGNPQTKSSDAILYAMAAGMDHCFGQGLVPVIKDLPQDLSQTTSYTRVYTESVPTYSGKEYRVQDRLRTQQVTETRPAYATRFNCRKYSREFTQMPTVQPVAAEMVHVFTRDFKGGLAVTPSEGLKDGFLAGDVLISIAGNRVVSLSDYYKSLDAVPMKESYALVSAKVIRNGKTKKLDLLLIDVSEAYRTSMKTLIATVCDNLKVDESKSMAGTTKSIPSPQICK